MNHYVRLDNNNIINAFSDVFESPIAGDVLVAENTNKRHFNLNLIVENLYFSQYRYKWSGTEIIEKTQLELNAEITAWKNNIINKTVKLKQVRMDMLNSANWINGLKTSQDYGHGKGINKKPVVISDALMNQWAKWFEDMTYWLDDNDLNLIDYDDIYYNSSIFPTMPDFPDDII